jgi:hypothetical protein
MAPPINFRCWSLCWRGWRVTGFAVPASRSSLTALFTIVLWFCVLTPFPRRAPMPSGPALGELLTLKRDGGVHEGSIKAMRLGNNRTIGHPHESRTVGVSRPQHCPIPKIAGAFDTIIAVRL